MRFVIQRVQKASVTVEEDVIGEINKGYMVLIGVSDDDTREVADKNKLEISKQCECF